MDAAARLRVIISRDTVRSLCHRCRGQDEVHNQVARDRLVQPQPPSLQRNYGKLVRCWRKAKIVAAFSLAQSLPRGDNDSRLFCGCCGILQRSGHHHEQEPEEQQEAAPAAIELPRLVSLCPPSPSGMSMPIQLLIGKELVARASFSQHGEIMSSAC